MHTHEVKKYIQSISSERQRLFLEELLNQNFSIGLIDRDRGVLKITKNGRCFFIAKNFPSLNTKMTNTLTRDKHLTKSVLDSVGIATPKGVSIKNYDEALGYIQQNTLTYPLVAKPSDAAKGVGIHMNIIDKVGIKNAIKNIKALKEDTALMVSDEIILEETIPGSDYRVLVLDNKVIGCVQRIPAHIVGDGQKTIEELITKANTGRLAMYTIQINSSLLARLHELSLSLDSVLPAEECLFLKDHSNISSGGTVKDFTSTISPRFKKISLRAANSVGGVFIGVDIITKDITSNDPNQKYAVIELNGAPGYNIHESPTLESGEACVRHAIIDHLYKKGSSI